MKVGMISSWTVPCGVAQYCEALCDELVDMTDLKVYAEVVQQVESKSFAKKEIPFTRCWNRFDNTFNSLYDEIINDLPDLIHIQHESALYNSSMYPQDKFLKFIQRLHKAKIPTVMTLHNVPQFDPTIPNIWYPSLKSHFIVTNRLMEKELKKWHPDASISTIPLGSTIFEPFSKDEARGFLNLDIPSIAGEVFYIVQFGFFGVDKGMLPLIEAMPKILKEIPDTKLVFAGSVHPLAPQIHKDYVRNCIKKAMELNLIGKIHFVGKFISEEEADLWLSAADLIAINHQFVFGLYSSSASAHRCLCAERPILMNASDVRLSEFRDGVHCVKATNENLAEKIVEIYQSPELQRKVSKGAKKYALETSFDEIAKMHMEVYKVWK